MLAFVLTFAVVAAASGGAAKTAAARAAAARAAVSGSVTFDGIWTGSEATDFGDVIKAFNKQYPNVKINYKPLGNNETTVLATAITGGNPPDMADIAAPGYVKQLVQQGHLKPITYAKSAIGANFAPSWLQLGTFSGKLYALVFKASNKSQLWYNVPDFKAAGIKPPATFAQLLSDAQTLKASGDAGVLDRGLGRLDAHRPVREHLPAHVRAREVQPADGARRSSGPTRR